MGERTKYIKIGSFLGGGDDWSLRFPVSAKRTLSQSITSPQRPPCSGLLASCNQMAVVKCKSDCTLSSSPPALGKSKFLNVPRKVLRSLGETSWPLRTSPLLCLGSGSSRTGGSSQLSVPWSARPRPFPAPLPGQLSLILMPRPRALLPREGPWPPRVWTRLPPGCPASPLSPPRYSTDHTGSELLISSGPSIRDRARRQENLVPASCAHT